MALHQVTPLDKKSVPSALLLQHSECNANVATLHDAVAASSLGSVHSLLRARASVDRRSHREAGNTALQHALAINNVPSVEALLAAGEPLNDLGVSYGSRSGFSSC